MEAEMCSCDFVYEGVAEVHREKVVRSKKRRPCYECSAAIEPGERYHYIFQVYDHEVFSIHVCIPCERIRANFCAPYGTLRETLWEHLGFDYVTGEEATNDV